MASITARPKKDGSLSYLITVSLGRDAEGNKIKETVTFTPKSKAPTKAKKEAETFAAKFEEQVKNGDVVSGDRVTFSEFVEIWRQNWLPAKTPTVRENYYNVLRVRVLPKIGKLRMTAIRATHIDKILKDEQAEGKAPKTIRMTYSVTNSVFKYAVRKQYIRENPCLRCDDLPAIKAKTGNDICFFNKDQARRFIKDALTRDYDLKVTGHRRKLKKTGQEYDVPDYSVKHTIPLQWRIYFTLAIYGQFRRGEECGLTWRDIDLKKNTVSINKALASVKEGQFVKAPKTDAGIRDIVIPSDCIALLRQWKKEQRALCLSMGTAWKGHRDALNADGSADSFEDNTVFIQLDNGLPLHLSTPGHKFAEIIDLYNAACENEAAKLEDEADRRKKLAEKLPKIRLHDLRHTGATLLLSQNTDIETVSRRLGHSKASVTLDIYGHALPENDKQASDTLEAMFI